MPPTIPPTTELPSATVRPRLEAVDLLRGLLMLLMAVDHTRDYFSNAGVNPTDPLHSWPALFLTRWMTHLCAPGFTALCGASVYLQRQRGRTAHQTSRLLLTRGLWFLILDVTLISFGWNFTLRYPFMNIISTIGICMIGLAALQRLSTRTVGIIGALIVLLHNLLNPVQSEHLGNFANLWILLHERNFLTVHGDPIALVYFPVLAWFGIICLGYAFGPLLTLPYPARRRFTFGTSAAFLAIFAILRLTHGYRDSYLFERLTTPAQTAMSFFQVQKYPPSLHYVLATFGILLLLYGFFDAAVERGWIAPLRSIIVIYGRVPFLFYVLHIYLIHATALLATYAIGGNWRFWIGPGPTWGDGAPPNWGYSLPVVYAVWFAVVVALYFPCRWFSQLKARRRDWWLSYL